MSVATKASYLSSTTCPTRTVVVLGGSYGGSRAAQVLAEGLPQGWRVVLVDRNSHRNHFYNFSRYAVLPGHEHKAFIPYKNFPSCSLSDISSCSSHVRVQATIISINSHRITLSPNLPGSQQSHLDLDFDYAIYALGSHLPQPIDLWNHQKGVKSSLELPTISMYGGTKSEGISSLRERQKSIEAAKSVLIVGGGALGIQFASDIAAVYPQKQVTLLHSRRRLLPKFDDAMHEETLQGLQELNVQVILGERLDFESLQHKSAMPGSSEPRVVRTLFGREISADLLASFSRLTRNRLLCTGQTPNTGLLRNMDPRTVSPDTGLAHVLRTMQLCVPPPSIEPLEFQTDDILQCQKTLYPNIFVVGDAADAFDAIKAGHTSYYQAEVAARNILRLISRDEKVRITDGGNLDSELEEYAPGPPAIKVTLGMTKSVYEVDGVVDTKNDGVEDLGVAVMWAACGMRDVSEEEMFA
ncbi:uncharacterized protein F5891DRAFT_958167 [Suillus fuscotomentosus]|uniref:FAD/NAD(P)-binding domain-containing protein n=1 Tax=Suillus fuscotomentosus TaxID=1912939 RepID=A0AAD4E039_9AGAM|nr:uncharacterized protein F5891DRAFT_958167 [Suillus fuscotomentosus]KAG1896746.1 hypothetical protein F5891DRAFT_958167 [Suillus fuscotomentosus]